ncbi:hypothetical protein EGR_05892 [Echinococcus granulosus]|uniref:Uncharacterized protein n=1 Tax=Echinococcus granulosus TaxID=6210 RepID=W6UEF5_ECHGR|nr:hypothetical protein EGR_05892 [Echinococcus granulosus]EUB59291.1 hypothetical protein EGR_05892 [Echinococcus granulosus]
MLVQRGEVKVNSHLFASAFNSFEWYQYSRRKKLTSRLLELLSASVITVVFEQHQLQDSHYHQDSESNDEQIFVAFPYVSSFLRAVFNPVKATTIYPPNVALYHPKYNCIIFSCLGWQYFAKVKGKIFTKKDSIIHQLYCYSSSHPVILLLKTFNHLFTPYPSIQLFTNLLTYRIIHPFIRCKRTQFAMILIQFLLYILTQPLLTLAGLISDIDEMYLVDNHCGTLWLDTMEHLIRISKLNLERSLHPNKLNSVFSRKNPFLIHSSMIITYFCHLCFTFAWFAFAFTVMMVLDERFAFFCKNRIFLLRYLSPEVKPEIKARDTLTLEAESGNRTISSLFNRILVLTDLLTPARIRLLSHHPQLHKKDVGMEDQREWATVTRVKVNRGIPAFAMISCAYQMSAVFEQVNTQHQAMITRGKQNAMTKLLYVRKATVSKEYERENDSLSFHHYRSNCKIHPFKVRICHFQMIPPGFTPNDWQNKQDFLTGNSLKSPIEGFDIYAQRHFKCVALPDKEKQKKNVTKALSLIGVDITFNRQSNLTCFEVISLNWITLTEKTPTVKWT